MTQVDRNEELGEKIKTSHEQNSVGVRQILSTTVREPLTTVNHKIIQPEILDKIFLQL